MEWRSLVLVACAVACSACGGSLVLERPAKTPDDQAVTELWADEITRVAKSGDWLLSRSYSLTGDVVVGATIGESLSHAALYDAERQMVIEAIHPRVREVPLREFLARNRTVLVVRHDGWTPERGSRAVGRARSRVGAGFDYVGGVGWPGLQ
jgi:uncharacterized protein YycO